MYRVVCVCAQVESYRKVASMRAAFSGLICIDSVAKSRESVITESLHHRNRSAPPLLRSQTTPIKLFGIKKKNQHSNGVSIKLPKDAVHFWHRVVAMRTPQIVTVPDSTVLYDPIKVEQPPIRSLSIRKVFPSKSRPILIDCHVATLPPTDNNAVLSSNQYKSSSFILKSGDDLRRDRSVMMVFKWINHLLSKRDISAQIVTYKVVPIDETLGFIEYIPNCVPLRDIGSIAIRDGTMANLVSSSAACYVGSYLLCARDRHFDNILISETLQLFGIDFNYVLGDTVKYGIDANEFGITREFKNVMGCGDYQRFVDLAVECYLALRQHHEDFISFVCLAFSFIFPASLVRAKVEKKLRLFESEKKAATWMRTNLTKAHSNMQTVIKNKVHRFATR